MATKLALLTLAVVAFIAAPAVATTYRGRATFLTFSLRLSVTGRWVDSMTFDGVLRCHGGGCPAIRMPFSIALRENGPDAPILEGTALLVNRSLVCQFSDPREDGPGTPPPGCDASGFAVKQHFCGGVGCQFFAPGCEFDGGGSFDLRRIQ